MELTRGHGVQTELRTIDGAASTMVPQYARYADLCILGRDEPEGPASINYTFAEQLLFVTGRPVLFVPAEGSFATLGRHIAVAWNSSRPAARSLNDALPLIERAERTTIIMVNPSGFIDAHEGPPGEQMVDHLKRHGATVDAVRFENVATWRDRRQAAGRSARLRRRFDRRRRLRASAAVGKDARRRHARSARAHEPADLHVALIGNARCPGRSPQRFEIFTRSAGAVCGLLSNFKLELIGTDKIPRLTRAAKPGQHNVDIARGGFSRLISTSYRQIEPAHETVKVSSLYVRADDLRLAPARENSRPRRWLPM